MNTRNCLPFVERNVHCALGLPLDIVNMDDVVFEITNAAAKRRQLFISTINLNFVTLAQRDASFRKSLLASNLCLTDGVAVQHLGKLLGVPIPERVAGSDILKAICEAPKTEEDKPLRVFFFGGTEEAGRNACKKLNQVAPGKVTCIGHLCPGFGNLEEMSSDAIKDTINQAKADFLIVSLGAKKGQAWIMHNMAKLDAPVISHLGATINFIAGTIKRAPVGWQKVGLEWLWRIKEEPGLAKRYSRDGISLLGLATTRLLPLAIWLRWNKWRWTDRGFSVGQVNSNNQTAKWMLEGAFAGENVNMFAQNLDTQTMKGKDIECDVSQVVWADTAAMGSLLLLSDMATETGGKLRLVGAGASLRAAFRLNGLGHLLAED